MERLAYRDAERILAQLGQLPGTVVLVGGQALNFWAERYLGRAPALAAEAPFTSKDIDFCGGPEAVEQAAGRLGGRAQLNQDPFSEQPNTGLVEFEDADGDCHRIDFLRQPLGLDQREVLRLKFPVRVRDASGRELRFFVLPPHLCLESRVHNTDSLARYRDEHGLSQLRAAIVCAREYVRELLDRDSVKAARKLNERCFRFSRYNDGAQRVFERHRIETFEGVLVDERLGEKFVSTRYPQMRAEVERKRAKLQ